MSSVPAGLEGQRVPPPPVSAQGGSLDPELGQSHPRVGAPCPPSLTVWLTPRFSLSHIGEHNYNVIVRVEL